MPNDITPKNVPINIGNKNLKFSFTLEKKFKIEFKSFSYIPKITHKTPLLIPGSIAPEPMKNPIIKFFIKNILFTYKILLKKYRNMQASLI